MGKHPGRKFSKFTEDSRGFTLLELLAAVGILAVLCAIAIPSLADTGRSWAFARNNDCARQIFLAAQANLTRMRAEGRLNCLQSEGANALAICGAPDEDWSGEYVYTASGLNVGQDQPDTYALVLPEDSVEDALRDQQVIIEYNPITGNVYSVFYSDKEGRNILDAYQEGSLPRNGEADVQKRRDWLLGYYEGSGQASGKLEILQTQASMTFQNGEEGIVTLKIPMPDAYIGSYDAFVRGLEVSLTIRSKDDPGKVIRDIPVKARGAAGANCSLDVDGRTVLITYVLDSLADRRSFANLIANTSKDPSLSGQSLTAIRSQSQFTSILPGENVSLHGLITFHNPNGQPPVLIRNAVLQSVNPMFDMLTENASGGYTLTISNGRNLQNLNALAPAVAEKITHLVFSEDIYWNRTVAYYDQHYGSDGSYQNREDEAPARALPYFVPISNGALFGSAKFVYETRTGEDGASVPILWDALDTDAASHARISGRLVNGSAVRIFNLNIDATGYALPNGEGCYYVTGPDDPVSYQFTGLFAYLNTEINNVHVVNPIVKGMNFQDTATCYSSPATGALIGAAGWNARITSCAVYIDTGTGACFDRGKLTQADYDSHNPQTWYGVSGEGAVGGLVGYAKSRREEPTFSHCFAAVNVSGNLRGNENAHFGYSNGIGGLVGNCQMASFYNCYASGHVRAQNCYVVRTAITDPDSGAIVSILGENGPAQLPFCGRRSMGAGGFAGTSHASRYTNCFSTGNVSGTGSANGVGGFVGIMCYEETLAFGMDDPATEIARYTVFENCYAVGLSQINGQLRESFSGANARVKLQQGVVGSYYRVLAPRSAGLLPDLRYIFKDSYYLARWKDASQSNTRHCAAAESYDHLTQLHQVQRSDSWISARIQDIQQIVLGENPSETYESAYFSANPNLPALYTQAYAGGFPTGVWGSIQSDRTHPYSLTAGNQPYPFPMLKGLDYYGDWPGRPLLADIVYYEDYADGTTGYYYDCEDTATLNQDKAVVSDGYAILTANRDDLVQVTIHGKTLTLTPDQAGEYRPGGINAVTVYQVFRIPEDLWKDAPISESGYLTATVYIRTADSQESWQNVYFNPNTAISHLTNTTAAPTQAPDEVYIRTARQFAALSRGDMTWAWTAGTTILQQRHIDAASYDWNGDGTVNGEDTNLIPSLNPIGTEEQPFQATYSGCQGCVMEGFLPTNSIFGTVGPSGSITDLKIRIVGDTAIGDDQQDPYTAVLAAYCSGRMENVELELRGNVVLKAKTAAGLLAGCVSGTESDPAVIRGCSITAENITVNAENAGSLAGILKNGTVENLTVNLQGIFQGEKGVIAGVAAQVTDSQFQNITVTIFGTISGGTAAGMFGTAQGVTVQTARVTINGRISGKEAAAGFALGLSGSGTTIAGSCVTPAAGNTPEDYLGNANTNLTIQGSTAALFAVEIGSGVTVSQCCALGAVYGDAVSGFADTNSGTIRGSTANVTITGGYAFVRNNENTIENCYGWYGDGSFDGETAAAMGGCVVSCYFADLDVPVLSPEEIGQMPDPERYRSVLIYDSEQNPLRLAPLDGAFTPELLNGEQGSAWFAPGSFDAFPFSSLLPKFYPYPMLFVHYGDWAPAPSP